MPSFLKASLIASIVSLLISVQDLKCSVQDEILISREPSSEGSKDSRNREYQFWRQGNQPTELYSPKFVFQKINYIHNNPVESVIVEKPEDYYTAA